MQSREYRYDFIACLKLNLDLSNYSWLLIVVLSVIIYVVITHEHYCHPCNHVTLIDWDPIINLLHLNILVLFIIKETRISQDQSKIYQYMRTVYIHI